MIDIFCLVLVLLFLKDIKLQIPDGNADILSENYTHYLKGICAVIVVFHHISQQIDTYSILFKNFTFAGSLAVGIFFALSGYGCAISLQKKGPAYLKHFLSKRLISIFIPYFTASFVIICIYAFFNVKIDVFNFFLGWTYGSPFVQNSWYVFAVVYFYILFWAAHIYFKKSVVIALIAGSLVYIILFHFLHYGSYAINTAFCFALGYCLAQKPNFRKAKFFSSIVIEIICGFTFVVATIVAILSDGLMNIVFHNIATFAFVLFVIFVEKFVQFRNPFWYHIGMISYELYLIHGLIIFVINRFQMLNVIKILLIFAISIALAYPLHFINNQIGKYIKKRLQF